MATDKDQNNVQADHRENGETSRDTEKDRGEVVSLKEFSVRRRIQPLASKVSSDSEDDPDPGPSAA